MTRPFVRPRRGQRRWRRGGVATVLVVLIAAVGVGFHGWGPTWATASPTTATRPTRTTSTKLTLKVRPRRADESSTGGVTAVFSLHDSRSVAGESVEISSQQLQQECPGGVTYTWGTVSSANQIIVTLDKAATASVTFTSSLCSPGSFTVLANFVDPPYDTASATVRVFTVQPPAHMSIAVTPNPVDQTSGSLEAVVHVVSPDALEPVTISSVALESGCSSVSFTNADGATSANSITVSASLDYTATVTLDATDCQAASYEVRADAPVVPYPTASTPLQVVVPS